MSEETNGEWIWTLVGGEIFSHNGSEMHFGASE